MPSVEVNSRASTAKSGFDFMRWKVTKAWATAHNDIKTLLNSKKSRIGLNAFFIYDKSANWFIKLGLTMLQIVV